MKRFAAAVAAVTLGMSALVGMAGSASAAPAVHSAAPALHAGAPALHASDCPDVLDNLGLCD